MRGRRWTGWSSLLIALFLGCGGGIKEDPILRLSSEEAFEQGKELMEREKYRQAGPFLDHSFEVAPNSATGRQALLLAADALFLDGGTANFIKAEAKYRDFQNRFPTSDRGDYVQLQIANCLAKQMLRPDRDRKPTLKALDAFQELLRLYPTSDHTEEAKARIVEIRQDLAEHEFLIGKYNFRRRLYRAAISRLEGLSEDFADYREMDKVLYFLGMSYYRSDQVEKAQTAFDRLRGEHPESAYVRKIPGEKKQT